jgi:parallel beta-helix repeat protein
MRWEIARGAAIACAAWALFLLVFLTGLAVARDCGGGVPCSCGDAVRSDATLDQDLVGCSGTGLRVRSGAVLDCDGHSITGLGTNEGVLVDSAAGAEVRNCRIGGFSRGVRLRAGGVNVVENNEIFANRNYGIELAVATTGNLLQGNLVRDSGDEGIHVGTGADANQLVGNQIVRSHAENLYLLKVSKCTVTGNTLSGSGAAAIYVKDSDDNTFTANTVDDRIVHVRGDSTGNVFTDNELHGAGFVFQAYHDDSLGWTFPHDNQVNDGLVVGADTCFRFAGAYDNHAQGVVADACRASVSSALGGRAATGNSVILRRTR